MFVKDLNSLKEFANELKLAFLDDSIVIPNCELKLKDKLAEIRTENLGHEQTTILYSYQFSEASLESGIIRYRVPPEKKVTIEITKDGCTIKEISMNPDDVSYMIPARDYREFLTNLLSKRIVKVSAGVARINLGKIYVRVQLNDVTNAPELVEEGDQVRLSRKVGGKDENISNWFGSLYVKILDGYLIIQINGFNAGYTLSYDVWYYYLSQENESHQTKQSDKTGTDSIYGPYLDKYSDYDKEEEKKYNKKYNSILSSESPLFRKSPLFKD